MNTKSINISKISESNTEINNDVLFIIKNKFDCGFDINNINTYEYEKYISTITMQNHELCFNYLINKAKKFLLNLKLIFALPIDKVINKEYSLFCDAINSKSYIDTKNDTFNFILAVYFIYNIKDIELSTKYCKLLLEEDITYENIKIIDSNNGFSIINKNDLKTVINYSIYKLLSINDPNNINYAEKLFSYMRNDLLDIDIDEKIILDTYITPIIKRYFNSKKLNYNELFYRSRLFLVRIYILRFLTNKSRLYIIHPKYIEMFRYALENKMFGEMPIFEPFSEEYKILLDLQVDI